MKRQSRFIFIIITVLILFAGTNIFLFQRYMMMAKGDVGTINNLGIVRGSIQRFTKLELVRGENEYLKNRIDSILDTNIKLNTPHLDKVYEKWQELKVVASDYRNNPDENNTDLLIQISEVCWELADQAILKNQYIAENKTDYLILPIIFLSFELLFGLILIFIIKKYVYDNLENFAAYDNLTKAYNRRYFIEYLNKEISRAERKNASFCLIMFDIDYFKNVNDTYGHSTGDELLKTLTGIVQKDLRKSDMLSRIGGEEFTILLPDTKIKEAVNTAERARKAVENYSFKDVGKITVSFGVTAYQEGDIIDDMLKRSDTALYLAKNGGRNRTEII